jgi:hypothetical protein
VLHPKRWGALTATYCCLHCLHCFHFRCCLHSRHPACYSISDKPASRCYCLTADFQIWQKFAREASRSSFCLPKAITRVLEKFRHALRERRMLDNNYSSYSRTARTIAALCQAAFWLYKICMKAWNMDRDSDRSLVGRALQGDISLLNVAIRLQVSVLAPSRTSQARRQCETVGCRCRTVMSSLLQLSVMHGACIRRTAEPSGHKFGSD